MKKFKTLITVLLFLVLIGGCNSNHKEKMDVLESIEYYHSTIKKLTDIIVHDIFSPPVASRIYAYSNIAAYETLAVANLSLSSLSGQLSGLEEIPQPDKNKKYDFEVAAIQAFIVVGRALVYSEEKFNSYEKEIFKQISEDGGLSWDVQERSMLYGEKVGKHILVWANEDNYKETRTLPKYTIPDDSSSWKPTPPDYMEGIEPHWNKIRTFIIDSASQFRPVSPTKFNLSKGSQFYQEMIEVFEAGNNLTEQQKEIAKFWDCNPFVSHHSGHVMFATKKITPGGHWIGITSIACISKKLNFVETVDAYLRVSIGMADAFISCWDEKWRSVLIRPETLINQYIDDGWMPLLQTPPFPEYTSGHSVVSGAASIILTDIFGENFFFHDTTELEYGLTARDFSSFSNAAEEAAISRLYGGIHYMPAITNGIDQGREIGRFVVKKLTTLKK